MSKQVLLAHVPYQVRGGEDIHVGQLQEAYRNIGITPLSLPPELVNGEHIWKKSLSSLCSGESFPEMEEFFSRNRVDFVHIHNLFPALGPHFLRWLAKKKTPTLMTIHNHRFFCTNGLALRGGEPCKACFNNRIPWRALVHNCNGSYGKSVYHTVALAEVRGADLLHKAVTAFIAPSHYIGDELVRFGIQKEKVRVILHPTKLTPLVGPEKRKYDVIYAGRISPEKGIKPLLTAVNILPDVKFLVLGSGAPEPALEGELRSRKNLEYRTGENHEGVQRAISETRIGVLPSICNEALSLFALEVFSQGKYCVLADSPSMRWFAANGFPGRLAKRANGEDLARVIRAALQEAPPSTRETEEIRERLAAPRFERELADAVASILVR